MNDEILIRLINVIDFWNWTLGILRLSLGPPPPSLRSFWGLPGVSLGCKQRQGQREIARAMGAGRFAGGGRSGSPQIVLGCAAGLLYHHFFAWSSDSSGRMKRFL